MRELKCDQGGVDGKGNGSCKASLSPSNVGSRAFLRSSRCRFRRGPQKTSQAVRLLLGAAVLLLAVSLGQSATAGQLQYICKDNTRGYSSEHCNGHGGVKSTTVLPLCGDGVLDVGEACDNGSRNSDVAPNNCRTDCRRRDGRQGRPACR